MRPGPWELAIILAVVVIIFGPKKLPTLGKSMAEFFKNFKKGVKEIEAETTEVK